MAVLPNAYFIRYKSKPNFFLHPFGEGVYQVGYGVKGAAIFKIDNAKRFLQIVNNPDLEIINYNLVDKTE